MIRAICTWGFAEDVLIVSDREKPETNVILLEDPKNHSINPQTYYKHGLINDAQIPLTAEQAINLGVELIKAGIEAKALNSKLEGGYLTKP
jgi:hypothetical protein